MPGTSQLDCVRTKWQGRDAYLLANGVIQVVTLTGGGHIAELRFTEKTGRSMLNPLWVPNWKTIEPFDYRPELHKARYGATATGKMISGIVGHNLCLDYFGPPSEEEASQGLSIHGEAPSARWRVLGKVADTRKVVLRVSVRLPVAGLLFRRQLSLRKGESVVYFKETVTNLRNADHFFHWTQHVTLGTPFLEPGPSRIVASATRGKTYPHGYEGRALLASSREFRWPLAPAARGGRVDLTRPFLRRGLGFVASALLDPRRENEYIAAANHRERLLIGYCFRRRDFPWVAIWEENRALTERPWDGRCQARGLEFGSTPIPLTRRETFAAGPLFNTPTFSIVSARGQLTVHYVAFLAELPGGFGEVRDIHPRDREILIRGTRRHAVLSVRAFGLAAGLI